MIAQATGHSGDDQHGIPQLSGLAPASAHGRPSIAKQRSNRKPAELKRKESEADLAVDADS